MNQFISKEAFENLKLEIKNLKEKRKEIAERLKKSASYGDLTENSEYQQAREDKEWLERKISEMENKVKNLKIKKREINQSRKSEPYSTLKIKQGQRIIKVILVSPEEIDLAQGKISYDSPLGKGLLNRKKGEKVEITTPGGKEIYEVLDIIN